MDIDGIGPYQRPGDPPGGPFFGEDLPEVTAGSGCSAIVGAVLGGVSGAAGTGIVVISLPGLIAGGAAAATLYASCCGIKWLWNQF